MQKRTLTDLAALCGASLEGDGERTVDGPAALDEAGPEHISFLANPRYEPLLLGTRAAAVLVRPDVERPRDDIALLRCEDPGAAFTKVVLAFCEESPRPTPGVHPTAVIEPGARLGADVHVGPLSVVGAGAELGDGVVLQARCVVGAGCVVGAHTELHPGVVLYPGVTIGARCTLQAGCVIGSEGFGFEPGEDGWCKVPQCGTVVVGDDVDIGALSAIDRARFGATRIGSGSKLDNLVHLGHNVVVEEGALLVAQVGVSGSARIARGAILGGQVGVAGHVTIGARSRIAGGSGVYGDLPPGKDYLGIPARPRAESLRSMAATRRLPERLRAIDERLHALEAHTTPTSEASGEPASAASGDSER